MPGPNSDHTNAEARVSRLFAKDEASAARTFSRLSQYVSPTTMAALIAFCGMTISQLDNDLRRWKTCFDRLSDVSQCARILDVKRTGTVLPRYWDNVTEDYLNSEINRLLEYGEPCVWPA